MVSRVGGGAESSESRGVTGGKIEGGLEAAVGILNIADQHEVHIITGHAVVGRAEDMVSEATAALCE